LRHPGRRLLVVLAVVGVAGCALANRAAAVTPSVTASCDTPGARDACDRWYRVPWVSLSWQWGAGGMVVSGCSTATFTAETVPQKRSCTVHWSAPDATVATTVWIGIDRAPPQLVAMAPDRPADYNGWFNRPVGLRFRAVDRTSGVASCSSTSYGGPDALGAAIRGSCTDVAGNTGYGAFPLNYDATPPSPPAVEATPRNRRVTIAWTHDPFTVAELVRIRPGGRPRLLYRGPGTRFTHRRLHNGRRYRYRVTLIDQAGNRSAARAGAVPTSSPLRLPTNGAHVRRAPLLVWKRMKRATYYNVQVVRRGTKILTSWPRKPHLQLHQRWRFNHRRHRLVRGRYCWYVWPGLGTRSAHRYGRLLGKSCFVVVR
jgi:hypothetical protein